jgi:hypothetical protein
LSKPRSLARAQNQGSKRNYLGLNLGEELFGSGKRGQVSVHTGRRDSFRLVKDYVLNAENTFFNDQTTIKQKQRESHCNKLGGFFEWLWCRERNNWTARTTTERNRWRTGMKRYLEERGVSNGLTREVHG